MFARLELKAWKIIDFEQNYDTLHIGYMALAKMLYAIVDDNRNGYSLLFVD